MLQSRQLALPSYLVAFSLAVLPPLDQLLQIFPLRIADARWRFGAFGLLSTSLLLPTVAVLIALVVAIVFDHWRFRRVIGVAALVAVFVLAAGLVMFALDVLQVRNEVTAQATRAFHLAGIGATIKSLLAMVCWTALGITAIRGPKHIAKPTRKPGVIVSASAS